MTTLISFIRRLSRIGIEIELLGNYPWIYLDKVNGNRVKEKFQGEHGFTVAFYRIQGGVNFTDLKTIFQTLRKYK